LSGSESVSAFEITIIRRASEWRSTSVDPDIDADADHDTG
jgi:hypothetical protein